MISIRRQLTRELLLAFLVLLGVGLAALYFAARDELIEQFDDALRAKAAAISSLALPHEHGPRPDAGDQLFRNFSAEHPHDFFEVRAPDGDVLMRSDSLGPADLPASSRTSERPHIWNIRLPNGDAGRALAVEFRPDDGDDWHHPGPPLPPLELVVASASAPLNEALTELLALGGACGLLGVMATGWVVSRVLRRGLQPLDHLGEQAAGITADSLTTRFATAGMPTELAPIAGRLNELLARLEISFERERRFSADLAHELRTPLAELRSLAECALKWPETRDPATDAEVLAAATQMQSIVTSLLALARAEQQQLVANVAPVNLAELAREAWAPHAARAQERGLRVLWNLAPATANADPTLLRSILGNLFENAADYASAGGEIEIALESDANATRLRVVNTVDSLDSADVAKMFDRFWRKEAARSGGRHFGLGLSLSRMFAQAMGWTLTAQLDARGRLEIILGTGQETK